jgi:hypothetical protein
VARAEDELKKLKSKTGVASLDEQRRILLNRMGAMQQEVESSQTALVISRVKVKDLQEKLAGISPTLVTQETKGTGNYGADLMRSPFMNYSSKSRISSPNSQRKASQFAKSAIRSPRPRPCWTRRNRPGLRSPRGSIPPISN